MVDNKGSAELTFTNYGNNQGLTLIFKGKMAGKGINRYQLTQLSGLVAYKKDVMTEEEATKIKEDKTYYTFEKESSTTYYFNMTKKGLERFMSRDNPERYFVWEIHHLPWETPELFFKNVLVSEAPLVFTKIDK